MVEGGKIQNLSAAELVEFELQLMYFLHPVYPALLLTDFEFSHPLPALMRGFNDIKCVSKVVGQLCDSRTSYIASVTIIQREG